MTAATVEATRLADSLALETLTGRKAADYLETITDTGYRRQLAGQLAASRREELALARTLLLERFGHAPTLAKLEDGDETLAELTLLAIA